MRVSSAARNPVACCEAAAAAVPARSGTSRRNHFMALNIRLITFPFVSEFVFRTHNAAFVQVMYEQYLIPRRSGKSGASCSTTVRSPTFRCSRQAARKSFGKREA